MARLAVVVTGARQSPAPIIDCSASEQVGRQRHRPSPLFLFRVAQPCVAAPQPPREALLLQWVTAMWLGREESNLRMAESKSAALPLGYAPMLCLRMIFSENRLPLFGIMRA